MYHRLAPAAQGAVAQLIMLRAAAIDGVSQKTAPRRGRKGPQGESRRPLRQRRLIQDERLLIPL
ncbi:MAG: hypothetical protein EBU29_12860 [Gammaproteobacteria bacterium]|nr:hypothetical protein [Gammaproteobacteria bacterium]